MTEATSMKQPEPNEDVGRAEVSTPPDGVHIHVGVVQTIARVAVLGVAGVTGFSRGWLRGWMGCGVNRGLRVRETADGLVFDVCVELAFGSNIPDVCRQIQEAVREHVGRMTGQTVVLVNVYVQGIRRPDKPGPGRSSP